MRHGLLVRARAPAVAPHLLKGALQIGGRIGLVPQAEPDPVSGLLAVSRVNMRPSRRTVPPTTIGRGLLRLAEAFPPLAPVVLRWSGSSRIHLPASLRSTVITRFIATTDALTPAGRLFGRYRHEHRLTPAGLPDYYAGTSGHSVSNHRGRDRRSSGCQRVLPAATGFVTRSKTRPLTPTESSSPRRPTRAVCVTDWSFSFRGSPPRLTATQLRFDTTRLFTAQKPTSTAPSQRLLRRTSGDSLSPDFAGTGRPRPEKFALLAKTFRDSNTDEHGQKQIGNDLKICVHRQCN